MSHRASVNGMLAGLTGKKAANKLVSAKLNDQKAGLGHFRWRRHRLVPPDMAFAATGLGQPPPSRQVGSSGFFPFAEIFMTDKTDQTRRLNNLALV